MSWYVEALLPAHLGVTKNLVEQFRQKVLQKKEWRKTDRGIEVSPAALQKLLEALGSESLDCSPCLASTPAAAPLEFIVTRVFPNPHLLECVTSDTYAGAPQTVRVRVTNNRNFKPRMMLKALPDPFNTNLYRLEGRCPRFPGRW